MHKYELEVMNCEQFVDCELLTMKKEVCIETCEMLLCMASEL